MIKYNHSTTGFGEHNLQVTLSVDLETLNTEKTPEEGNCKTPLFTIKLSPQNLDLHYTAIFQSGYASTS